MTGRIAADLFGWPEVEGDANIHGPLSFVIPSAVAGLCGDARPLGQLAARRNRRARVALARRGLPQDWYTTLKVAVSAPILRNYPESARIYLRDGLPPVPPYQGGLSYFRLGKLPETLEQLGARGMARFLSRARSRRASSPMSRAMGGVLSADDLRNCKARVSPAVETPWRKHTLQTNRPAHRRADRSRCVAADGTKCDLGPATRRRMVCGARARAEVRLRTHGSQRSAMPSRRRRKAAPRISPSAMPTARMVAMTTTLLSSMGSRVVLPGTGILMNNGVMWFDPRPGQPNSIGPGKRPLTNMFPVILRDGAKPWIAAGASGRSAHHGRGAAARVVCRRFRHDAGGGGAQPRIDVSGPDQVTADRRLAPDIMRRLQADGPDGDRRARRAAASISPAPVC